MLNELEQMDSVFETAEVRDGGNYENLPDGKYQVRVDSLGFEQAKVSGRPQFKWVLEVVSGLHEGRMIFHRRGLDNADGVKYFKQELYTTGFDPAGFKLSDLYQNSKLLEVILDTILEVTLKTKKTADKEYQNLYFNKRVQAKEATSSWGSDLPY